jgi:hypothetical protein
MAPPLDKQLSAWRVQAADPKDLKALKLGRGSLWKNILGVTLPGAIFVGLALFVLTRSYWISVSLPLILLAASIHSNLGLLRKVRRIDAAPEAAVECIEVEATHVLDLEPQGSNGPVIALLTESGECLLLVGQWLLEQEGFPSHSMRVYRWSSDGEPIRIESLGPKLKPVQSNAGLKNSHRAANIHIFPAKLATLEHDLDVALSDTSQR